MNPSHHCTRAVPFSFRATLLASLLASLLAAAVAPSCAAPTSTADRILIGAEIQAYPAGIIPGLHVRRNVSAYDAVHVRVTQNIVDRRGWGEHDDETGDGYGVGIGWRHSLEPVDPGTTHRSDSWFYGARLDAWKLTIDWKDPGRTGSTDVLVLQPTAEFGYGWNTSFLGRLELGLGLGAEFNIDTDGEDVGEGAIFLVGLTWLP